MEKLTQSPKTCFLSLLGDQDPINRNGEDGPILTALADLEQIGSIDQVAVVVIDSPGGVNQQANESRMQRLEDLRSRIKEQWPAIEFVFKTGQGNAAHLEEMETRLEQWVGELQKNHPWDQTLAFLSSGTFATQVTLAELAQWSILPDAHLIQRVHGSGTTSFLPSRRPQEAAIRLYRGSMQSAAFRTAEAAATELESLCSGKMRQAASAMKWLALALCAIEDGDLKNARDWSLRASEKASGEFASHLKKVHSHIQGICDAVLGKTSDGCQGNLGRLLMIYPTLSWREASKQASNYLTRARTCFEQVARVTAHAMLITMPSLAKSTTTEGFTKDNRSFDPNMLTGGTLRLWTDSIRREHPNLTVARKILVGDMVYTATLPKVADRNHLLFARLNNSHELHAGKPWAQNEVKNLGQTLFSQCSASISPWWQPSESPLGINEVRKLVEEGEQAWRESQVSLDQRTAHS